MEAIRNSTDSKNKSVISSGRHQIDQHTSVFTCTLVSTKIPVSGLFARSDIKSYGEEGSDGGEEEVVDAISFDPSIVLRIVPMEYHYGGWSPHQHFHPQLVCPLSVNNSTIVITFEAMARECIAIALSPSADFVLGKTYVVHFGANGDLCTVLRRRTVDTNKSTATSRSTEAVVEATFPSVRICSDREYLPYWIIYQKGKLSVGAHSTIPGKNCLGTLDDTIYHTLRPGQDAVRYVGIGNSSIIRRRPRPTVGRSNRDLSHNVVKVRHLSVAALPTSYNFLMESFSSTSGGAGDAIGGEQTLLRDYEEECRKAQARAKKFGISYTDPSPETFMKWSEARRLRANPSQGFATGFDLTTAEEEEKRRARRERFSLSATNSISKSNSITAIANDRKKRKAETDGTEIIKAPEEGEGIEQEEEEEPKQQTQRPPLPVLQAWDNEELVREFRVDPPYDINQNQAEGTSQEPHQHEEEENDEFFHVGAQTLKQTTEPANVDGAMESTCAKTDTAIIATTLIPEKLHIFAIDWAAFKQIRSEDIMDYFSSYGPSYIEWLGELSCNVLFEDRFSADRAFKALSQEIPSPPPTQALPTTYTIEEDRNPMLALPDLGKMGWRFCIKPLRKVATDRFGRKGTRARILMRVSNAHDILEKRPTKWPKPPPGFTTRRVLGPGSDFPAQSSTPIHRRPHNHSRRRNKIHKRPRTEIRRWDEDDTLHGSDFSIDEDKDDVNLPYSSALDRELKSSRYSTH